MPKPKKGRKHSAVRELFVQMQINRSNADAGDSGANIEASAVISVVVTLDGVPVADLGANAGNQTTAITLPAGWTLRDGFNVRPFGCNASVTEFANQGDGIYDIRIVPYVGNPACTWLSGEYIYGIQIKTSRVIAGKTVSLQGSALGKLTIL
ncbi:MAG TPA: hypothetical protein VMG82_06940 [Candidatus Sulfotelmatobacter sp.]|nr:hypothetical protein [Candidatus Sulfotelmatobacter sp.]